MLSGRRVVDVEDLSLSQRLTLLSIALAVLSIYEHLLTLDEEIRFVWGRKLTGFQVLFFLNRYGGDFIQCYIAFILIYQPHGRYTAVCQQYVDAVGWSTFVMLLTVQGIIAYRIYISYMDNRRVVIFLVCIFTMEYLAIIGMNVVGFGTSELVRIPGAPCNMRIHKPWFQNIFAPVIAYETIIICLASSKAVSQYGGIWINLGRRPTTVDVLLRDSVIYPSLILGYNVLYASIWMHLPRDVNQSFLIASVWVMRYSGSRLVLNIREANNRFEVGSDGRYLTVPGQVDRSVMRFAPRQEDSLASQLSTIPVLPRNHISSNLSC